MTHLKTMIVLCTCVVISLSLSACNRSGNSKVVGEWKSVEYKMGGKDMGIQLTVKFNSDGTAVTGMGPGTYKVEGSTVVYTSEKGININFDLMDDGRLKTENPATKIIYEKQ